jgi:hypothetical protein
MHTGGDNGSGYRSYLVDENTAVPIISTSLENPVLLVQGHVQLLQGGGVVFDTRQGQQIPEDLIGRVAPGAQHFE